MEAKINGKKEQLNAGLTLNDLLVNRKVRPEMVAVEINGNMVDRDIYKSTVINEGDEVEYLYYMGGGVKAI